MNHDGSDMMDLVLVQTESDSNLTSVFSGFFDTNLISTDLLAILNFFQDKLYIPVNNWFKGCIKTKN